MYFEKYATTFLKIIISVIKYFLTQSSKKSFKTVKSVDSSKTKVLATESNTFKRRIRKAIEIRLRKPSLNRDNGFELANIYNTRCKEDPRSY